MHSIDDVTFRADPGEQRAGAARRGSGAAVVTAGALALAVALAAGWWWTQRGAPAPSAAPAQAADPAVARNVPAPALEVPDEPTLAPGDAVLQPADIPGALADLLGHAAVQRWLLTQDFPRRFVATVDALGREHAPIAVRPVVAAPGRFAVEERADGSAIAAANAARYDAFVGLVGSVDAATAVALYRRMYPLLQQSYRELGLGKGSFHARLVAVIDQLLAAPEPAVPPAVQLTQVQGPVPSLQPWTRYEFVDPALERLAAGQKIMVRVGLDNERKLKRQLRQLRAQLLQPAAPAR